MKNISFGIIGGDARQCFLKKMLCSDGFKVNVFKVPLNQDQSFDEVFSSDFLIFPFPVSRDGEHIQPTDIKIKNILNLIENKKIFCGAGNSVKIPEWQKLNIIDYSLNEDFIVKNAWLTAEGTIKILLKNINKSFRNSKCLITGFGRIGKILTKILLPYGIRISVLVHSPGDASWIRIFDANPVNLEQKIEYDFIVNTAPDMIFSKSILEKLNKNAYILDLASVPGIDFESAKNLGLKAERVLGIPGNFFAEEAAYIIKNEIYCNLKLI